MTLGVRYSTLRRVKTCVIFNPAARGNKAKRFRDQLARLSAEVALRPTYAPGAGIVKSATMNGHFNFHYDEALAKFGPDRGWFITSWNEMNPSDIPRAVRQPSGQVTFTGGTP